MAVRFVTQYDHRIGDVRRFWLVDVVYRDASGTRQRVRRVASVTTEKAARDWERRLKAELAATTEKGPFTLAAFIEKKFWPVYPTATANRPSTTREKEVHLRCHIIPRLGELALEDVDAARVDAFTAALVTGGLAAKTVANVLVTLGTVLRTAARWGLIASVPHIRKPRATAALVETYTPVESARLLAAASGTGAHLPLLLSLHAGLRAGEILALRWEDIDFDTGQLIVRRSRTRDIEGPTKSGRERAVPMSQELARVLAREHSGCTGNVVLRRDGSPASLHDLHRLLDAACERAGVRRLRFHDLRHTFATQIAAAGVPLRYVQEWLGHADLRMLLRYVHAPPLARGGLIPFPTVQHRADHTPQLLDGRTALTDSNAA